MVVVERLASQPQPEARVEVELASQWLPEARAVGLLAA
jgi:hypothetical protein